MKRHRAMDKEPRHPFIKDEYVKSSFYCDIRDRDYLMGYINKQHMTQNDKFNLLRLENSIRLSPSEVKDILKESTIG